MINRRALLLGAAAAALPMPKAAPVALEWLGLSVAPVQLSNLALRVIEYSLIDDTSRILEEGKHYDVEPLHDHLRVVMRSPCLLAPTPGCCLMAVGIPEDQSKLVVFDYQIDYYEQGAPPLQVA